MSLLAEFLRTDFHREAATYTAKRLQKVAMGRAAHPWIQAIQHDFDAEGRRSASCDTTLVGKGKVPTDRSWQLAVGNQPYLSNLEMF